MQYVTPTNSPRNGGSHGTPGSIASIFNFSPASLSSLPATGSKLFVGTGESPIDAANSLLNFSFEGSLYLADSRPSTPMSQIMTACDFADLDLFNDDKENVPPMQDDLTTTSSIEKNETLEPVMNPCMNEDVQVKTISKTGGYRKRSFCEIDDDEDWSFVGLDFLRREEDDNYKYPSWKSKPSCGSYKPNKGPPTVSGQRNNVKSLLKNKDFQEKHTLFRFIKDVVESDENDFMTAEDFCEKYDIRPNMQLESRARPYEKWVVFYDSGNPFITKGLPQALDYRINKHAQYGMKKREVRLMKLYVEEYKRLFIKN